MANIQTLLQRIMSAIYGEEVRGSIHDAIEAINDEVETWTGLQDGTVTTQKLASNAVTTAKVADGAITRAKLNADVVDTTLAVSGVPADAKTTGDKVTQLKSAIELADSQVEAINNAYMKDDFSDITSELTTVGNGYYNNPAVMGTTQWSPNNDTITYSYSLNAGDVVHVIGYNYYACRLVFFDSDEGPANDIVYPSTTSGSTSYDYTFVAPTDGTLYIGTAVSKISALSVGISTEKVPKVDIEGLEALYNDIDEVIEKTPVYDDVTSELEIVGSGYYERPASVGLNAWRPNDGAVTYKIQGRAGEAYKVGGYTYYACKLYFLYNDATGVATSVFPSTTDANWHEDTFTLLEDCTIYVGSRSDAPYLNQLYIKKARISVRVEGSAIKDGSVPITALSSDANPLYGKKALFFGDSICHGTSVGQSSPYYGWGWAGRIGTKNNMNWYNLGISGRTVLYRNGNGESNDVAVAYQTHESTDYVILEACLNDGFQSVTQGTISDAYTDEFDNTASYCEAFEYMIKKCIEQWPSARIGVIIPHKVTSQRIPPYQELARSICKKWSIPYIDLFYESGMTVQIEEHANLYFSDGATHLSDAGYDMITPKIEAWMKTM